MALALNDRVQQTGTANTTVSFTLSGSVTGFQSFAVIGNGNTTYYAATDGSGNWEVGLGTYSTTGPTLTRTTVYSSSNSNTAVTFSGSVNVFVTYPSSRSVFEDESGNVSPLGTIASATWQGSTIGVAYGGTGVTSSSGANSVVLRDANENIAVNRLNQANANTTAAGGTTTLTAASSYSQTLTGTGNQTYKMPDATTLTTGVAFSFNNNATGTLTLQDSANGPIGTIPAGGAVSLVLLANGTVAGTWNYHGFAPENIQWGTNTLYLANDVITGGIWNGGTIASGYGGTGLTTFTAANNALYSSSSSALVAGTLPIAAGGTGATTALAAYNALSPMTTLGDITYEGAGGSALRLGIGSTNQVLTVVGGVPAWATAPNNVSSISFGTTGLTPNTASTGAVTVAGTLAVANGGTGNTTAQAEMNRVAGAVTSGQYLRGNGTNVVMSAIQAADVPTLNQSTTGTAANVTGIVAVANGGTGASNNGTARTNLGATTVGSNFFTLTNPSAVTFPRMNADNTVSALDAATFRTAIGAGTSSTTGTVTSVSGTGSYNGLTLSGTVTTSGNITFGGTPTGTWPISITGASTSCSGNASTATSATSLNSSNFISRTGSSGNLNTDFQNTPSGTTRIQGDDAGGTNNPGNTWWFYQNMRHNNNSNFWGTQVAWGWEDNANRLATRNITGGSFGGWVYYLNSANFTSYAPSLTGSGASGTWGINITGASTSCSGNAATATNASNTNSISNATGGSYTWTNQNYFQSNRNTSSDSPPLQAYSSNGSGAIMAFHRAGAFAVNFGLDSDNVIRIGGWSAGANRLQMDMSGNLTMAGNVTAFSDERKKKNWRPVTENFVEKLADVKVGVYDRVDEEITQVGVSAQSLQEVMPEAVLTDNDGFLSVAYGNAAMASAVELAKELVALKELVKELKAEVDELKKAK